LESQLRKELNDKDEAYLARLKQREQELTAQLNTQAQLRLADTQAQWEKEAEKKARAALEPYLAKLERLEKERDEARQAAADSTRHVESMEKKFAEASSFLSGWKNGKRPAEVAATQPGRTDWTPE
jgi:type I site-specific restriction endonuclease